MKNPGQRTRTIDISRAGRPRPPAAPAAPRRQAFDAVRDEQRLRQARRQPPAPIPAPGTPPQAAPRPAARAFDYEAYNADPDTAVPVPRPGRPASRAQARRPAAGRSAAPARRKKAGAGRIALRILASVLCVLAVGMVGLYWYISHMLGSGGGSISNNSAVQAVQPPELTADQMNILVLGLDYEEDGAVERSSDFPMTDMILYVQFDRTENSLTMLQIPRDCYIGAQYDQYTANTGKINGVYAFGPDQENKVQNLVDVLNDQLKLPVDGYVTIDMQSLTEMFDAFGGPEWALEVYVPVTMEYDGSRLETGYHYLKGEELEFFLRQRKDTSATPRGDYDRLNNQRYFYSALFKYMKTMSISEMMRLVPWALKYVNTSIDPLQCVALALALKDVPNDNIAIGRLPVYDTQVRHNGQLCSEIAAPETADFLNQYFRPAEAPVDVSQLDIASLGLAGTGVVDPEMSHMGAEGMVEEGAGTAAPDASSAAQDASAAPAGAA